MTIDQQENFDTDFNAMCAKYNIAFAVVAYVSKEGEGERTGIVGATNPANKLAALSNGRLIGKVSADILSVLLKYEQDIQKAVW